MHRVLSDFRSLVCGALFSVLAASGASAQATLTSDQPDYGPGTIAVLTGAGFAPSETVAMQVVHADGEPSTGADHEVWYVESDDQGGFVATWHVCEDDCVGEQLLATADQASGAHAETLFMDSQPCGTGVVTVIGVGGTCVGFTPAQGGGPDNWEVAQGGTYLMRISGVTECTGSIITVFIQHTSQSGEPGNFCFNAVGGAGTYSGVFTMSNPACFTYPISYKCGPSAPCSNANTFDARGPTSACGGVHLRAATFDAFCQVTGKDENCSGSCVCTAAPTFDNCSPGTTDLLCNPTVLPGCDSTITAHDNCGPVAVTCSPSDVTLDCVTTRTITYTATNGCGTSTCVRIFTWKTDTTAPQLSGVPEGGYQGCNNPPSCDAGVTAFDDCDGEVGVHCELGPISGPPCARTQTITYSAQDSCGNPVSQNVNYSWTEDTTPPVLVGVPAGGDQGCNTPPSCDPGVTADDNCDGAVGVHCEPGPIGGPPCARTQTITYSAQDSCGNPVSQAVNYTWKEDTTKPVLSGCEDITRNAAGDCCVAVTFNVTANDNCDGELPVTSVPASGYCFPLGTTTVYSSATDGCTNKGTCSFKVTVLGQICAIKYYDANANNVQDSGEVGIAGWDMVLTPGNIHQSTDATGKATFNVLPGNYTVAEGTPTQANWVHTGPASIAVTINSGNCSAVANFGNYCFSAPSGGFTLGYWSNKNGEKALAGLPVKVGGVPCWVSALNTMACFRNADGTLHTFTNYADLKSWLLGGTATNMAYMLSVQLASNVLSGMVSGGLSGGTVVVVPGKVTTGNGVCIVPFLSTPKAITCGAPPLLAVTAVPAVGSCACTTNNALVTVSDLRTRACCLLQAYGNTTGASTQRTYQECVKNILDMLNNNGNNGYPCGGVSQFINADSSKCPATFVY